MADHCSPQRNLHAYAGSMSDVDVDVDVEEQLHAAVKNRHSPSSLFMFLWLLGLI